MVPSSPTRNIQQNNLTGNTSDSDDDAVASPKIESTALSAAAIGISQAPNPTATNKPVSESIVPNNLDDPESANGADAVVTKDNVTTGNNDSGDPVNSNATKKSGSGGFIHTILTLGAVGGVIYLVYWIIQELGEDDEDDETPAPTGNPSGSPSGGGGGGDKVGGDTKDAAASIRGLTMLGMVVPAIVFGLVLTWVYNSGYLSFIPSGVIRSGIMLSLITFASGMFALGYTQWLAGYTQGANIYYFIAGGVVIWFSQAVVVFSPLLDPFADNFSYFAIQLLLITSNLVWVGLSARLLILGGDSQDINVAVATTSLFLICLVSRNRIRKYAVHKTCYEQIKENFFESSEITREARRRAGVGASAKQIHAQRLQVLKEKKEEKFEKENALLRQRKELIDSAAKKYAFDAQQPDFDLEKTKEAIKEIFGNVRLDEQETEDLANMIIEEEKLQGIPIPDAQQVKSDINEIVADLGDSEKEKEKPNSGKKNNLNEMVSDTNQAVEWVKLLDQVASIRDSIAPHEKKRIRELKRIYTVQEAKEIAQQESAMRTDILDVYEKIASRKVFTEKVPISKSFRKEVWEATKEQITKDIEQELASKLSESEAEDVVRESLQSKLLELEEFPVPGGIYKKKWKISFWSKLKKSIKQLRDEIEYNEQARVEQLEAAGVSEEETLEKARQERIFEYKMLDIYRDVAIKQISQAENKKTATKTKKFYWKKAIQQAKKNIQEEVKKIADNLANAEALKKARESDEIKLQKEVLERYEFEKLQ